MRNFGLYAPSKNQQETLKGKSCAVCWWIENKVDFLHLDPETITKTFKVCDKHEKELETMKPKSNDREFVQEAVPTEEWINAEITDVKYEENHEFGGQFAKTGEAVRLVFKLEGFQQPKSSRWLTFSYGEKSNLYLKFLKPLVDGAKPYMDYDIQRLKGTKCRLMFSSVDTEDGKTFYNIEMVRPLKDKASVLPTIKEDEEPF